MPAVNQAVTIPRKLMQQLLHNAQATPDVEVCGLICAVDKKPSVCRATKNVAEHPQTRFQMDEAELLTTFPLMRQNGETLFGIYHSHPTAPALPTPLDLELSAYPEAFNFIISLNIKGVLELRCFKINALNFEEITLNITD